MRREARNAVALSFQQQQPQRPVAVRLVSNTLISIHGVNPLKVYQDCIDGKYNDPPDFLTPTSSRDYECRSLDTIEISRLNTAPMCLHKDVNGETYRSITTEVGSFAGEQGGECIYCRYPFQGERFGYCCVAPYMDKGQRTYIVRDKKNCSPECLLAHLRSLRIPEHLYLSYRDWTMDMLKHGFGLANVVPADDYRFLEKNDGTQSYAAWTAKRGKFKKMTDVIILPSKEEYRLLM